MKKATVKKVARKGVVKKASPKKRTPLAGLKRTPVKKTPRRRTTPPVSMLMYGQPGVGKTSFAANFPDPVFLVDPGEYQGIQDLVATKQCEEPSDIRICTSFPETINEIDNVTGLHKTLVIDSLTGIQHQCFSHCCEQDYLDNTGNPDWSSRGFYSYQQGPATAATRYWEPVFINSLILAAAAGMNVILLAHSEIKPFDDPVSGAYDRYQPFLHKQIWQYTKRWVSLVLFYNYDVDVVKTGSTIKKKPDLATQRRLICTTRSPVYEAKQHHGMPDYINAGNSGDEAYTAFQKQYTKAFSR